MRRAVAIIAGLSTILGAILIGMHLQTYAFRKALAGRLAPVMVRKEIQSRLTRLADGRLRRGLAEILASDTSHVEEVLQRRLAARSAREAGAAVVATSGKIVLEKALHEVMQERSRSITAATEPLVRTLGQRAAIRLAIAVRSLPARTVTEFLVIVFTAHDAAEIIERLNSPDTELASIVREMAEYVDRTLAEPNIARQLDQLAEEAAQDALRSLRRNCAFSKR